MANILRVRTQLQQTDGNPMLSTHYIGGEVGAAQDAADAVNAFWSDLLSIMSNACDITVLPEVDQFDDATGNLIAIIPTTPGDVLSGSSTSTPLPFATQAVMHLNTAAIIAGRRLSGRLYIPAVTEAGNDDGTPNTSIIEALQSAGDNLITATDSLWGVFSRVHHTTGGVSSVTPWHEWGVMRSRRS